MPYGKGEFHEHGYHQGRHGGEGRGYGTGRGMGCKMRKHEHGYGRMEDPADEKTYLEHRKRIIEEELRYLDERLEKLSGTNEE